ncbi:CDP-glucose 4,6-dehydratase [Arcobacter sp. LA11]|uniref:CDP-glucose 4,6-dehydratase n=1 Tax=Arcobacter sp. LA11 TaxID=1898176 RepID=UPI0009330388|nr:CDP-glucose 4,6-dehydratase [Arcobacter sp. LA11]
MESITYDKLFKGIYKNKTVLVTGHTGFKGSWLCYWLIKMGAKVIGYSLEENTKPNHFSLLNLDMTSIYSDIRDIEKLNNVFKEYQPDIVFHLAAQPLVRLSYISPVTTFETNMMGTINILEVIRKNNKKIAILNITSDKCYENNESKLGYVEDDKLSGYDPYSASKACSEIITSSYRDSFFNLDKYNDSHRVLVSSCRSGNVIGGGDWNEDRIIPDIIKAITKNKILEIRNPKSTRPWQHVLEPLSAYLLLGQKLLESKKEYAKAWNFGPKDDKSTSVEELVLNIKKYWSKLEYKIIDNKNILHETNFLKLDSSQAYKELSWQTVWDIEKTFNRTISWYKKYYEKNIINTSKDLDEYIFSAKEKRLEWTND